MCASYVGLLKMDEVNFFLHENWTDVSVYKPCEALPMFICFVCKGYYDPGLLSIEDISIMERNSIHSFPNSITSSL